MAAPVISQARLYAWLTGDEASRMWRAVRDAERLPEVECRQGDRHGQL